jgi:hypothetical protein
MSDLYCQFIEVILFGSFITWDEILKEDLELFSKPQGKVTTIVAAQDQ